MLQKLFRRKNLDEILAEAQNEQGLKKALGAFDLVLLGIGAIIGTGIFATVGTAALGDADRPGAGPAMMISFVITCVACAFTALCYAEFAAMVPISGSAYTYSYATLGEIIAWIIGWDLIIEYAVGNVAVAISWAGYFKQLVEGINIKGYSVKIPLWLCNNYTSIYSLPDPNKDQAAYQTALAFKNQVLSSAPHIGGIPIVFNLPAVFIVVAITAILVVGVKESAKFNALMVITKIIILLFFIIVGAFYVKPANWVPFAPNGIKGVLAGASVIFFAYIGFDAVSTVAEETKNPKRDMPIGIIGSLLICTVFYIVVAAVLTGMIPYQKLAEGAAEPLAIALKYNNLNIAAGIVAFGAVIANTAVLLVFQLGQPRIFFSMGRDGLLPPVFSKIHPKFKTPHVTTILTGVAVAATSAFSSIEAMVDLTNIGTLFAFILVCVGIIILRVKDPNRERPFKAPFGIAVPILGILSCVLLIYYLPITSVIRFIVWLAVGLVVYFLYGAKHSTLNKEKQAHPQK
jgi:APA family basic amino acid/polyamine antiporter